MLIRKLNSFFRACCGLAGAVSPSVVAWLDWHGAKATQAPGSCCNHRWAQGQGLQRHTHADGCSLFQEPKRAGGAEQEPYCYPSELNRILTSGNQFISELSCRLREGRTLITLSSVFTPKIVRCVLCMTKKDSPDPVDGSISIKWGDDFAATATDRKRWSGTCYYCMRCATRPRFAKYSVSELSRTILHWNLMETRDEYIVQLRRSAQGDISATTSAQSLCA